MFQKLEKSNESLFSPLIDRDDCLCIRLEEIKLDIGTKLEKTAKLNLDNADTTKELEAMREAHQIMLDSLKIQMETFQKELDHIRNTR